MSQQARQYVLNNQAEILRLENKIQDDVIKNTKLLLATAIFSGHDLPTDDTKKLSDSVVKDFDQNGFPTVAFTSPYAVPVEFGMPSGISVNVDELKKWVMRKLGVTNEGEAMGIAIKIKYKILREGIRPTRFFKKAIKLTIGQRGVISTTVSRPQKSSFSKTLTRLARVSKLLSKYTRKIIRIINRINKYKRKLHNV